MTPYNMRKIIRDRNLVHTDAFGLVAPTMMTFNDVLDEHFVFFLRKCTDKEIGRLLRISCIDDVYSLNSARRLSFFGKSKKVSSVVMGIYMQAAGRMTEILGNDYRSAARRLIKRGLRGMDVDWTEEHTDRILRHSRVSVPLIDTSDDVGSCRDTMRCTFSIVMRAKRINSRS